MAKAPAQKPAKTTASRKAKAKQSAFEVPLDQLAADMKTAQGLIAELDALLDGFITLTPDERLHSSGRMRDGEPQAMRTVLDAADARPAYFASLAARDGGSDDTRFETAPARDRLDRRDLVVPTIAALEPVMLKLCDTVLELGTEARDIVGPIYAIARVNAVSDVRLRSKLAPATAFYTGIARRKKPKKDAK